VVWCSRRALASCIFPAPQGARGARARGRGWAWGTTRGAARPQLGLGPRALGGTRDSGLGGAFRAFGERGLGRGGGGGRAYV
jgi:hypothetical protein